MQTWAILATGMRLLGFGTHEETSYGGRPPGAGQ